MSARADTQGAPETRVLLGQVLVEAGVLTPAALDQALAEQQVTRQPLGQLLVERGYVAKATIANALAEQHGGLLKTEYGFATGLSATHAREDGTVDADLLPPPVSPVSIRKKAWSEDEDGAVVTPIRTAPGAVPPEPAPAATAPEPPVAPPLETVEEAMAAMAGLRLEIAAAEAPADAEPAEQTEPAAVEAPPAQEHEPAPNAELDALRGRLDEQAAELEELRAQHEAALGARTNATATVHALGLRIEELEAELSTLGAARDEAVAALAEAHAAAALDRARLEESRAEVERRAAETESVRRRLEEEAERRAQTEGALAERGSVEEIVARLATVHAERDESRAAQKADAGAVELAQAVERTAAAEARAAAAEAAREAAATALEQLRAHVDAAPQTVPSVPHPTFPDDRHVLFVPSASGYELREEPGPSPGQGSELELPDGRRFRVTRVGPSPLPGARVGCAYLEPTLG